MGYENEEKTRYDWEWIMSDAAGLFPQVVRAGEMVFGREDADWLNRSCAQFCVAVLDRETGEISAKTGALLGGHGANYDRRKKYLKLALEKTDRLGKAYRAHGHRASSQSRDPEAGKWGGAVVVEIGGTMLILSLSGLPERGDEAFCLLLAIKLGGDRENCFKIAQLIGNECFKPMYNMMPF